MDRWPKTDNCPRRGPARMKPSEKGRRDLDSLEEVDHGDGFEHRFLWVRRERQRRDQIAGSVGVDGGFRCSRCGTRCLGTACGWCDAKIPYRASEPYSAELPRFRLWRFDESRRFADAVAGRTPGFRGEVALGAKPVGMRRPGPWSRRRREVFRTGAAPTPYAEGVRALEVSTHADRPLNDNLLRMAGFVPALVEQYTGSITVTPNHPLADAAEGDVRALTARIPMGEGWQDIVGQVRIIGRAVDIETGHVTLEWVTDPTIEAPDSPLTITYALP